MNFRNIRFKIGIDIQNVFKILTFILSPEQHYHIGKVGAYQHFTPGGDILIG